MPYHSRRTYLRAGLHEAARLAQQHRCPHVSENIRAHADTHHSLRTDPKIVMPSKIHEDICTGLREGVYIARQHYHYTLAALIERACENTTLLALNCAQSR